MRTHRTVAALFLGVGRAMAQAPGPGTVAVAGDVNLSTTELQAR